MWRSWHRSQPERARSFLIRGRVLSGNGSLWRELNESRVAGCGREIASVSYHALSALDRDSKNCKCQLRLVQLAVDTSEFCTLKGKREQQNLVLLPGYILVKDERTLCFCGFSIDPGRAFNEIRLCHFVTIPQ